MTAGNDGDAAGLHLIQSIRGSVIAHVPAKWIRFADKDMRQHKNLRRFPFIWDHSVIPYERKTP
jgi:hypothetical protein